MSANLLGDWVKALKCSNYVDVCVRWAFIVLVSNMNINLITLSSYKISCFNRNWPHSAVKDIYTHGKERKKNGDENNIVKQTEQHAGEL